MGDERVERRLAAIVVADVVGYSRLTGADEAGTRARLNAHMDEVVRPSVEAYGGRLVGIAGDGALLEFPSVVDAVEAAVAVQRGMAARNANEPAERRIDFRIGVNLGDVIVEGDDIHGDGVNVAARIEALADPGGICLSRAARDQIRDRLDHEMEDMGEVEAKNIARPVRAFRLRFDAGAEAPPLPDPASARAAPAGAAKHGRPGRWLVAAAALAIVAAALAWMEPWAPRLETASVADMRLPLPDRPSVAVLPFDVASDDPADRAFADAVAEDLTRGLAQVAGLFVIARSSTLDFVGADASPARAAEELGVRHVVRATLRRAGERVRIDADLVDALSGRIVWSDRFERPAEDLFALQDELVATLAKGLARDLPKAAHQRRFTEDVQAHFAWFEGDRALWLNTAEDLGEARALALYALERDPGFVRAQALLAMVDTQRAYFRMVEGDPGALLRQAHAAAADAAEAAPGDWYARAVLAQTLLNLRDYEGAAAVYDEAIALSPANPRLLTRAALPLIFLGRGREAEARLRVAIRLNPLHDWLPDQLLGQSLFLLERYEEAAAALDRARENNPRFIGNMWWRAATHGQLGNADRAREAAAEILDRMPGAAISGSFIQIHDEAAMERFREGLRTAGLPE